MVDNDASDKVSALEAENKRLSDCLTRVNASRAHYEHLYDLEHDARLDAHSHAESTLRAVMARLEFLEKECAEWTASYRTSREENIVLRQKFEATADVLDTETKRLRDELAEAKEKAKVGASSEASTAVSLWPRADLCAALREARSDASDMRVALREYGLAYFAMREAERATGSAPRGAHQLWDARNAACDRLHRAQKVVHAISNRLAQEGP